MYTFIIIAANASKKTDLRQHLVEAFKEFAPVNMSRHNAERINIGAFRVDTQAIRAKSEQLAADSI